MSNYDKLLEKTKIDLIMNEAFFASIALMMEYKWDNSIRTAATNGIHIKMNEQFFASLQPALRVGLIAHEVLHIVMHHHLRLDGRDPKIWNMACDYAINPLLKKSGFKLHDGALFEKKYENKSAEQIYAILIQNQQQQNNGNGDSGDGDEDDEDDGSNGGGGGNQFGEVEAPPATENLKELEERADQMSVQAANVAKQAGKLPGFMEETIKEILDPKQSWRELLQKYMAEVAKNDYTWTSPNRRFAHMGLYLPSLKSTSIGKLVIVVDTSGSIDNHQLSLFNAEIQEMMSVFDLEVDVIPCDTHVDKDKIQTLQAGDKLYFPGRGGTHFQPAFDHVNAHYSDAKVCIYFTDGDAGDNYKEPNIPVLWAITGSPNWKAPFGTVIHID